MVKVVRGRLENGYIVPLEPLPATLEVRSVAIILEVAEGPSPQQKSPQQNLMDKWYGVLRGYTGDAKEDYRKHLEEKYL